MEREEEHRADGAGDAAYAEDGVDLTLVRWMLSLTPEERLRVLQEHNDAIESMREASKRWTSEPS